MTFWFLVKTSALKQTQTRTFQVVHLLYLSEKYVTITYYTNTLPYNTIFAENKKARNDQWDDF